MEKEMLELKAKAKELFVRFNEGKYSLNEFKHRLICLSYDIAALEIWDAVSVEEYFIPEYIERQCELYAEGSRYLLSVNSSGSLLQQFYMALEVEE